MQQSSEWTPGNSFDAQIIAAPIEERWRNLVVVHSCRQELGAADKRDIGAPHFSLSLSARRFIAACARLGVRSVEVQRPEIYGSDVARRFLAPEGERIVHLAIGDYATLRVLKSAYNIAYVAWEYGAISTVTPEGQSPWKNQLWVLRLFDEIWVGARFVKQVFERHGLRNVYVVPAPVPDCEGLPQPRIEQVIGRLTCAPLLLDFTRWERAAGLIAQSAMPFADYFEFAAAEDRPKVYLTIANPGDARKNIAACILGFLRFVEAAPRSLLVVKLVAGDEKPLHQVLWQTLRVQLERSVRRGILRSDAVVFVPGFLDEKRLMQLLGAADFYVSTGFAEGLNLPVLEAMSRGTVVIAPIHTAMADYLTPDNCVPCGFRQITVDGETVTGYPVGPVSRYEASAEDVAEALATAAALPQSELAQRRRNAAAAVAASYNVDSVAAAMASRFEEILRRRARSPED